METKKGQKTEGKEMREKKGEEGERKGGCRGEKKGELIRKVEEDKVGEKWRERRDR